jgi:FAD/FMN-containing dehydrogenase
MKVTTMSKLQAGGIAELKTGFGGELILPTDPGYDSARKIWNGMVDRRPALIARCATTTDVVRAVAFARDQPLPLAVRGGGHNIAGSAVCDDGVVVDLSMMRVAHVDTDARRAIVEGGALLSDLDAATQAHGLATPVGINSTTGIAGLTLGGGFGWLSRKYGMTVDNLESAEVVTASGEILRASAVEHPDLFWALRGGSGNFGVVTRFEFRLHPVGPELLSGLIVYSAAEARSVLRQYREFVAQSPDDLTAWAVLRQAPPLPFLPASVHGQPVVVLALLYAGDPAQGAALIEPLRRLGTPLGEHIGVQPYCAWQQAFDPLLTAGARNYWKSHNLSALADGLIDVVGAFLDRLPSPQCEIFIASLGGAASRPTPADTAYAHRDARFVMNVHARWADAADDARCIAWAREFFGAASPFATGGVYVNFLTADEGDRVAAAYGSSHQRLAEIKRRYDPDNLFHTNQNIAPAARTS